jgi:hypothetical protein
LEGKRQASVATQHLEGPQDSDKVFNSSLLLVSGHYLRELECLGLNNNKPHSLVVSQLLVSNKRLQEAYLPGNLLKLGLALGKVRVEFRKDYLVRRHHHNPTFGSNSRRLLSLVHSHSKLPHLGRKLRLASSLNNYLAPNRLISSHH